MKNLNYCWKCGEELGKKMKEGRERYYCRECAEIRYRNAIPVAGVFVMKDGEALLIKRGHEPNKGLWSYPAGFLEYDEKPEHGASRELEEETGLKVDPGNLELVDTIQLEHPEKYVVGNAYAAHYQDASGNLRPGDDAEDARFWSIEEMEASDRIESEKIVEACREASKVVQDSN